MQVWQLILAGVCVHLILFYSIFDIYFTSPLVHGMTPILPPGNAPANRLVLFVTDGLRADKFFEPDEARNFRATYLRNIIEQQGVWGVSHTRVPTESRPGHVALIAGFYEDVSAVAKGWRENPVDFDSVFNESRNTWSWGSPDILPMFAKGATGDHVQINCYSSDLEDFAGSDMTKLDTWVFEKVQEFFESASTNSTLKAMLHEKKIVFFLHLLGIDTHGHSSKPHSEAYLNNIKVVDAGIRQIVSVIEEFYQHDGKTSFVVTADHGMTDWGSHGAGHSHETLTPFVAWGAGIRKPLQAGHCGVHTDSYCQEWGLQNFKRVDMEQADIAPLMSSLIGIPFPVNSVGRLPIDAFNLSDKVKAELLLANAEQILAQFQVKMDQVKERTVSFTFRPFSELITAEKIQTLKHIKQLIRNGYFSDAIKESHILIDKALAGLRYYQTYDRLFLGISVVLGFGGWMMSILLMLIKGHTTFHRGNSSSKRGFFSRYAPYLYMALGIVICILLYIQSLSWTCYLYCLMPVLLWYKASDGFDLLVSTLKQVKEKGWMMDLVVSLAFCVVSLEIIILSFYYRELLSVGLLVMAMWPLSVWWRRGHAHSGLTACQIGWIASCILVAVFPLMPVVGKDTHYDWLLSSGVLALTLGLMLTIRYLLPTHPRLPSHSSTTSKWLYFLQLSLVLISIITVFCTSRSISMKQGLPVLCKMSSWTILGLSIILPSLSRTAVLDRLFSLSLSFLATYLLLSIAYEVFFFLSLSFLLYFWISCEAQDIIINNHQALENIDFQHHQLMRNNLTRSSLPKALELSDLRRAVFFIFLILIAFFGTGNIASINSFDPAAVYCFLTVFNPFLMGTLLMLKVIIPFLLVTCAFRAVQVVTGTALRSLFLIVLLMSDFMGMHFFFLVKDSGSWLEIGTTISHYVIVMTMIIFLFLLIAVTHALTRWSITKKGIFRMKKSL